MPIEHTFQASRARIAYVEWGERGRPAIFLIHATGFHARCWDQTVKALPEGFNVIAVDTRNHGRSEKTGPVADWSEPTHDIDELVEHLKLEGAIGAGHSMGGHVLVQVAARHPRAFSRLVLIDPVMMAPEIYADTKHHWPQHIEHPIARRRNKWASWQEMFDAFKDRRPYSLWRREVLEDYCRYGVMPAADGQGFELACPPAIEASIYKAATGRDIYDLVAKIDVPVTILRAKPRPPGPRDVTDFAASPTWEHLATSFKHGTDVFLPDLTHFIPMQAPELTASYIAGTTGGPRDVLDFWFGAPGDPRHDKTREEWFRKSDAFDTEIRKRFARTIEEALAGGLTEWEKTTEGTVALVLVLDQLTRNTLRDTPRAFAGDARALVLARRLVASGKDRALPGVWRQFIYLPFEHAEDLAAQEECLRLFNQLAQDEPALASLVTWAERHRVIVARFGRFPHRNAILGRETTAEEAAFLKEPHSSF